MNKTQKIQTIRDLQQKHQELVGRPNPPVEPRTQLFQRYEHPVLTADHAPLMWRFDFSDEKQPLVERLGINAAFNAGAIKVGSDYYVVARVEGVDRKSFFAVAQSRSPVEKFTFLKFPAVIAELDDTETNVYDMRLTRHEDGWIYGVFCVEYKDPEAAPGDTSSAIAEAGIVRTKDLQTWERLPNLKTPSPQQRNVVLHPAFIDGKYGFYTRPQDGFIETGSGGGIGWGVADRIEHAEIAEEIVMDPKQYHTVKEMKNGQGPAPIKTDKGWLHLAHGVRGTAAGLRYVLYLFMSDLKEPWRITHQPGGYCLAPQGDERVGDVSNVVFSNGWIADDNGMVYIYYGSSDTRLHVASCPLEELVDYVVSAPADPGRTAACVQQRIDMIRRNLEFAEAEGLSF